MSSVEPSEQGVKGELACGAKESSVAIKALSVLKRLGLCLVQMSILVGIGWITTFALIAIGSRIAPYPAGVPARTTFLQIWNFVSVLCGGVCLLGAVALFWRWVFSFRTSMPLVLVLLVPIALALTGYSLMLIAGLIMFSHPGFTEGSTY